MPLKDPVIDDRKYADILAEIRTRIPRYTPEWRPQWNDLNDSDPGMILAQTFAWLSEMLLFRMQRVPNLHYVKFLQLIGIELMPAKPARAEVTFTVSNGVTTPAVDIGPRTQVSADGGDGPPIVFETERALKAVACRLVAVQTYDGAVWDDWTATNDTPTDAGFAPFGEQPREDAALVLGFAFPAGHPNEKSLAAMPIDLAIFAADSEGERRVLQCDASGSRTYPSAQIRWEGFDGTAWLPLDALNDDTVAFTRSGHVVVRIQSAAAPSLQRAHLGNYAPIDPATGQARDPLFWIRARLVREQYERPPRIRAVRTNTVPVLQVQTVRGEILGGTTGARDQVFRLQNTPVLEGTLHVEINEGRIGEGREWTVVDDLYGSGPDDEHVFVNWSTGEVRVGNGEFGQVPVANPADPDSNVVATVYRYGGGKRGNVAPGAIANLLSSIPGIDSTVTNLFEAAGGTDEEQMDEARIRARQALRARERAVSSEDFETLARQAGNVKRARAVPLAHPDFPGVQVPGAVTVIIVPESKVPDPQPSDGLLRTVCAFLDARRLLTTELFVVGPQYLEVSVAATIVVTDDADPGTVKQEVEQTLLAYLHPLTGGEDGAGWPFGGTLRYSRLVNRVFSVDGVDNVPSLVISVSGEAQPECRDVPIDPLTLVTSRAHAIETLTAREFEAQP